MCFLLIRLMYFNLSSISNAERLLQSHIFTQVKYLCTYSTPAISFPSPYRTIIYLSIVYAIGQVALAVSAVHDITDKDRNGIPDSMTFHMWVSILLHK